MRYCLFRLRVVDADLNCRNWGAIHPCTFHRGAWGTVSLTCLQLEQCNLDTLPYQARPLAKCTFECAGQIAPGCDE